MDCSKALGLLSGYIDGTIDDELCNEIKKHIEICKECRNEYIILKNIISNCNKIDEAELPYDFNIKLHKRLIMEKKNKKVRSKWYRRYKIAAVFLAITLSFSIVLRSGVMNIGFRKKSSQLSSKSELADQSIESKKSMDKNGVGSIQNKNLLDSKSKEYSLENEDSNEYISKSITINLNEDEYKKHFDDIMIVIEGLGGYQKQKDIILYMIPDKNYDALIKKLKEDYKLSDIEIRTEDLKEKIEDLKHEIEEIESKQKAATQNSDMLYQNEDLLKKKAYIKDLNERINYLYVQVNKI